MHRFGDDEDTLVGRFTKSRVDIGDFQLFVLDKAVHTLTDHTKSFLNSLLESPSDSHHLTDRLHARP